MAAVHCSKCSGERKGFRRELDSWRHKLIHCVGFESILEGIYGPLLRDLNLFDDCEPEELDDWSSDANFSHCSFCNLPLDKNDQVPSAPSPLSSPSDYSPCQAPTITESNQSAYRFLQAVFQKKGGSDASISCDPNIPLVAQELMKKMIHQFAKEYASKCLLHTNTNGVTTRTSSPSPDTSDAPLDLTVSRSLEGKESECDPDGALDLSKRNSACPAASFNHIASGSLLPTLSEEMGGPGQRWTRCIQSSTLGAVLGSLCPSHCLLLYQILKLAHQENLLTVINHRPTGQTQPICCHCGVNQQENNLNAVPLSECISHNSKLYKPSKNSEHEGLGSTICHSGDSNCCFSHTLPGCKCPATLCSSCGCEKSCKIEACTILCPKRLRCTSCHSLGIGHNNNKSPALCCSTSVHCNQHNPCACPCYSNHLKQDRDVIERVGGEGYPPCPVLKREQSPSPPPLSPISSDIHKKNDEKPPSLHHHIQEEKAEASDDTTTENQESRSPTSSPDVLKPSGNLIQDVVNRFSEKLETIKPIEKDRPLVTTTVDFTEKETQQSNLASQNLQFHADAHLTEIITTVLHTGSASDYNLSELFNRHDSKEPKSPNTRFRRRQEVRAAMATPPDDASTRRQTLKIKRDLAMFDRSYSRKKVPPAKRPKLKDESVGKTTLQTADLNTVKEESKGEIGKRESQEDDRDGEGQLNFSTPESGKDMVKEELKTVVVTEEVKILKAEEKVGDTSALDNDLTTSCTQIPTPELKGEDSKQSSKDDVQTKAMSVTAASVKRGRPCKKICTRTNVREMKRKKASSEQNCDGNENLGQSKDLQSPNTRPQGCQSHHSTDGRRSRRNIVPPQRFSSYVTEPRKMFFVACFSENIFNHKSRQNDDLKTSALETLSKDPDAKDIQLVSRDEPCHFSPDQIQKQCEPSDSKPNCPSTRSSSHQHLKQDKCSTELGSVTSKDGKDIAARPFGRLRSSPKRLQNSETVSKSPEILSGLTISSTTHVESPFNSPVQYTSPIKLMFVSPVTDKEGVRYSLKSAGFSSSGQEEEPFDPCEESSWAGSPQKHKSAELDSSRRKNITSPLKSATSHARLASSPSSPAHAPPKSTTLAPRNARSSPKSAASPQKSASVSPMTATSPKSARSPPKSAVSPTKSAKGKSSPSPAKATPPTKAASSPRSGSSSPKTGLRRTGEGTPTKRAAGTESQRSPGDSLSCRESTPPKRRPGRPKKLGPQLEQKVKRPIGRPRKEKVPESVTGTTTKMESGTSSLLPDTEKNGNKNLKITVVYGRSRRNKRTVSEGFDQLQTELHDAWQAVGLKSDLNVLMNNCKTSSGETKANSTELQEIPHNVNHLKQCATQTGSKVKCQKQDEHVTTRKPGRPAKVKISGISVTVTTVSPRHRKIQINKDTRQSPKLLTHKKVCNPEIMFAKEPLTINHLTHKTSLTEGGMDTNDESKEVRPRQSTAVRQSMRVRKPSIHFLHAVATSTSRSYSHSNALLRRSKQFLLNKANNERLQGEEQSSAQTSGGKRQLFKKESNNISKNLNRVGALSVDSIFTTEETLRWWAASAEEEAMNQELARRIRLISDTWVSSTEEKQEKEIGFCSKITTKSNSSLNRKSQHPSVVRTLFDCPPSKPRSCSMQQLCSWFMQTTETQSLSIVKKASSRNPFELMHFPRSVNKKNISHSPQAERLRKHIKKFAKVVPKSPLQHQQAQRRMRMRNKTLLPTRNIRRQLFGPSSTKSRFGQAAQWRSSKTFGKYQATLFRARTRFFSQKRRREEWRKRQAKKNLKGTAASLNGQAMSRLKPKGCSLRRSAKNQSVDCSGNSSGTSSVEQTQEGVKQKEQSLCSKAWSPETLKECRVFLRKINSPDNESPEEEGDSCTVTLDDESPSTYHLARRRREMVEVVKAVKTERKRRTSRNASRDSAGSAPKSVKEKDKMPTGRQNGRYKNSGAQSAAQPPPPAKVLRQSRMRGLTGPRWCDFVFET